MLPEVVAPWAPGAAWKRKYTEAGGPLQGWPPPVVGNREVTARHCPSVSCGCSQLGCFSGTALSLGGAHPGRQCFPKTAAPLSPTLLALLTSDLHLPPASYPVGCASTPRRCLTRGVRGTVDRECTHLCLGPGCDLSGCSWA